MRDRKTGKSRGFCYVAYEDQRSTVLAVDNFNGVEVNCIEKCLTIKYSYVEEPSE
jgi:RNA-binding motif X-linked protein 2